MNIRIAKIAIVAEDAELAEKICSHLRAPGIYLPVIESPMQRLVEYGVFDQDCVRVSNALRNLDVHHVLLLGVSEKVASKLKMHASELKFVALDTFDYAKLQNVIRLNSFPIDYQKFLGADMSTCSDDVFVAEGSFDITTVISANLASAHYGKLHIIDAVSDEELDSVQNMLRSWSSGTFEEKQESQKNIFNILRSRLPVAALNSKTIKSISFVTRGMPYGLFPFECPTTHFFSFPLLGLNILAGMMKSGPKFSCPVVVLIDPKLVGQSEFDYLTDSFSNAGFRVRAALGQNATSRDASFLTTYLPSDFIFYSTHCGEVKGQRVTERFYDRNGNAHTICYDRVLSGFHCPTENTDDLYEVTVMMSWISIDGIDWKDKSRLEQIDGGNLIKDYLSYCKERDKSGAKSDLISVTDCGPVKDSSSLGMAGTDYLPLPYDVGGCHYPIVFNNACSSWRSLAIRFSSAGSAVYIGTSTDILNSVGVIVANKFSEETMSGRAIGPALFRAQRKISAEFGYNPYMMTGYLYTRAVKPSVAHRDFRIQMRTAESIKALERLPQSDKTSAALKYLKNEMNLFAQSYMPRPDV